MGTHPIFESDFDCLTEMSEKMIEMSGCSKIEIQIARMFWKSFTLQPPIESKLYSPDIKQRRTADAGGRRKNEYEPMQAPSYVYDYQKYQYSDEEEKRRGMIYHKRMQTLKLQRNLREIRQKKEEVSKRVKSANPAVTYETYNPIEARRETDEVRKLDFFKAKTIDYGAASYKL